MATPAIDVTQVVQVAAQAAQAAAQAATALQRFTDQRTAGGKFSEAGKVVRQPDPYGTDDVEQDISRWTEFYDNFRAWLFYADKEYEASLDHLENNTFFFLAALGVDYGSFPLATPPTPSFA